MPRTIVRLVFAVLVLGCFAGPAEAGKPQLFLTWHSPFGFPRAADAIAMADGDTTRTDTLYLSFDPGHYDTTFLALSVTLNLRCAAGDTLSTYWRMGPANKAVIGPRNPRVEFNDGGYWGYASPWAVQGIGSSAWDWTREAGRLRMVYAVGPPQGAPVDSGKTYVIARAIFRHPPARIATAKQPLCVEWSLSTFAYSNFEPEEDVHYGDHRWVSLNSPGGAVCRDYLKSLKTAPAVWDPKAKKP